MKLVVLHTIQGRRYWQDEFSNYYTQGRKVYQDEFSSVTFSLEERKVNQHEVSRVTHNSVKKISPR